MFLLGIFYQSIRKNCQVSDFGRLPFILSFSSGVLTLNQQSIILLEALVPFAKVCGSWSSINSTPFCSEIILYKWLLLCTPKRHSCEHKKNGVFSLKQWCCVKKAITSIRKKRCHPSACTSLIDSRKV